MRTTGERSTGQDFDRAVIDADDGDKHKADDNHERKQRQPRIAENAQNPHNDIASDPLSTTLVSRLERNGHVAARNHLTDDD